MKINLGFIALTTLTILIWYSIFTNGFFITLIWMIVLASIFGIILKLYEQRY